METQAVSVRGKLKARPAATSGAVKLVLSRSMPRIAMVHDEEWLEAATIGDPLRHLDTLRSGPLRADIFSYTRGPTETVPRDEFLYEWENAALLPSANYKAWWDSLSQESRRNVRLATKAGVQIRLCDYDDAFVAGISSIYNETPVRLGKPFWHYGKSLETVRAENGTYVERSQFIGAFFEDKLIGFIKMVFVDRIGSIMQILSMLQHQDKRTTNALIAKAVEVCESRGMSHLRYCSYVYGSNTTSLLTEFKRRNGFVRVDYPRYYVPLTSMGRVSLGLRVHKGWRSLVPPSVMSLGLKARAHYHNLISRKET